MTELSYTLEQIADKVGAECIGDKSCLVTGVNTLADATSSEVSFLTNIKYKHLLSKTQAAAVIVKPDMAEQVGRNALVHSNPHATFARVVQLFYQPPIIASGIAKSAIIADSAQLGAGVSIGPNVVIGEEVEIGAGTVIGANTVIQKGTKIGKDCLIYANVTLYHDLKIGNRVTIHSQSVIGADGFGYANDNGIWLPIPQLGTVQIGDDTSIAAAVTVDRGALGDTIIGKNVILDDQVHLGHNCIVGNHTCICGYCGIAGSCHIGNYVVIGGGCSINGHITIADKVQLTGNTMVTSDIKEAGLYSSGQPSMPNLEWRKISVRSRQIPELFNRVKRLEKKSDAQ